jgi:hypothetical protein
LNSEVFFKTQQPNILFGFRNIAFRINIEDKPEDSRLVLLIPTENMDAIPLYPLLKLLEERKVIRQQ